MGAVNTTYTFTATDTITSTKMNDIIDQTTITGDAILGTTLEVADGKLKIRSQGITSNELAANSITATQITDGSIGTTKLTTGAPSWNTAYTFLNQALDLGANITASTNTFIDFHAAFPVVGYNARIIREPGTNGNLSIINSGTGSIKLNGTSVGVQSGTAPTYGVRAHTYMSAAGGNSNNKGFSSLSRISAGYYALTLAVSPPAQPIVVVTCHSVSGDFTLYGANIQINSFSSFNVKIRGENESVLSDVAFSVMVIY